MSDMQMHAVLERSMNDRGFVERFNTNPEGALEEFDLAEREREALLSGDQNRINEVLGEVGLGVYVLPVPIVTSPE